jgi:hypothetical protein
MGILVLFVAVLSMAGGGGTKSLFRRESSGQLGEGFAARMRDTAIRLWQIYLALSLVCFAGLVVLGMPVFDAVCHTFATISTGGFSTRNASIGFYQSPAMEWWIILFMILGAISFMLYAWLVARRWSKWKQDEETRFYLGILTVVTLAVTASLLYNSQAPDTSTALRNAAFTVVSIRTTTGFVTADYDQWSNFSRILIVAVMFIGGCAGSTAAPAPDAQPVQLAPPDTSAPRPSDGLPASFHDAFTSADRRARAVAYWMQCVPTIARLRASGTFGPAARAARGIYCLRTADGVPIGGVYDVDSSFTALRRLQFIRLNDRAPHAEAVDTVQLLRAVRLARAVSAQIAPAWRQRGRPYTVVPITLATPLIEAWVIPRATKARSLVTGGDMGFTAAATNAPQLLEDRSTTWTQLNLAPSGPLRIFSSTREVPAVTDLASARYYTELGRAVTVSTPLAISTLTPGFDPSTGAQVLWTHRPAARQ